MAMIHTVNKIFVTASLDLALSLTSIYLLSYVKLLHSISVPSSISIKGIVFHSFVFHSRHLSMSESYLLNVVYHRLDSSEVAAFIEHSELCSQCRIAQAQANAAPEYKNKNVEAALTQREIGKKWQKCRKSQT